MVRELTRVAKAGYIEVPEAPASKILDFPTHLWWCRTDDATDPPTLVFTAKQTPWFDGEIHDYLRRTGLEPKVARMLESRLPDNLICLRWEGAVAARVEGELDPEFVRRTVAQDAPHHTGTTLAARALGKLMTGRGHTPPPLRYDDLVKPELRTGTGELLEPRIYRTGR